MQARSRASNGCAALSAHAQQRIHAETPGQGRSVTVQVLCGTLHECSPRILTREDSLQKPCPTLTLAPRRPGGRGGRATGVPARRAGRAGRPGAALLRAVPACPAHFPAAAHRAGRAAGRMSGRAHSPCAALCAVQREQAETLAPVQRVMLYPVSGPSGRSYTAPERYFVGLRTNGRTNLPAAACRAGRAAGCVSARAPGGVAVRGSAHRQPR